MIGIKSILSTAISTVRRPRTTFKFVPVIFANGEDHDLPGLIAMAGNKAVQFGSRIYEPGEKVSIVGMHLRVPKPILFVDPYGGVAPLPDFQYGRYAPDFFAVVETTRAGRSIEIVDCTMVLG